MYMYYNTYIHICVYTHNILYSTTVPTVYDHTRHILPASEIDLGLFWADFTGSEGKYLFHRIG